MRYSFQKVDAGEFTIYRSQQSAGDEHLKRFLPGVTPQNQGTLNIYISGSFQVTAGDYSQIFNAGDSSLDTTLESYPGGVVFTETVLSPTALRYCVSRLSGGAWSRQRVQIDGGASFDVDSILIVVSGSLGLSGVGSIVRLPAGQQAVGDATVLRCWVEPLIAPPGDPQ